MDSENLSQSQVDESTWLIEACSSLDNSNALEMLFAIRAAHEKGFKRVVLDLESLSFISSAGVGSILGTIESIRTSGGDIILCNVADQIRHVLEVLDLADFFTIVSDRSEAVSYTTQPLGR